MKYTKNYTGIKFTSHRLGEIIDFWLQQYGEKLPSGSGLLKISTDDESWNYDSDIEFLANYDEDHYSSTYSKSFTIQPTESEGAYVIELDIWYHNQNTEISILGREEDRLKLLELKQFIGKNLSEFSFQKSQAMKMPDFIPEAIKTDYLEAFLIQELSPKASATLSRRCLQGIIRDFWNIKKPKLYDEIQELKEKVDPVLWDAIDGVRRIGNIGAHMESDVNMIIEIVADEALLLIGLIEKLVQEWYIAKNDRDIYLKKVSTIAEEKDEQKKK